MRSCSAEPRMTASRWCCCRAPGKSLLRRRRLHSLAQHAEYREAGQQDIRANAYAGEFFEVEYRLDHRIHTFPRPVLCWGMASSWAVASG